MRRRFINNQNASFDYTNYMTIEALEDGLFVSFDSHITNTIDYCIDGHNWKKLTTNENSEAINTGQRISFREKLQPDMQGIGTFTINKNCNLVGNGMSLLFGDNASSNFSLEGKDFCFKNLFNDCSTIQSVSANFLPAITLADYCYSDMFSECTSLTTAPELPATTLAHSCYNGMFSYCTSLTSAPELPVTTLVPYCYSDMFSECTSLTTAPELPATTLAHSCYNGMFSYCTKLNYIKMLATDISASSCLNYWVSGVASTGTFVKNPAMTSLTTGSSGIPSGWTVVNDGEEIGGGSSLTFPVTLVDGDNGQLGIDLFNYLIDKYGMGYYGEIEEDIFIPNNEGGETKAIEIDIMFSIVFHGEETLRTLRGTGILDE